MRRSIVLFLASGLVIITCVILLIRRPSNAPRYELSTPTDEALGRIAARKFAPLVSGGTIALLAWSDDDNPSQAARSRRDVFLRVAAKEGLRIAAVVSPLAGHRAKMSEDELRLLPFRDIGIDAVSVQGALAIEPRPDVVISLEGAPDDLAATSQILGQAKGVRFFAVDPYGIRDWRPLIEHGLLQAVLAYRKDADWSTDSKEMNAEQIAAARFLFVTPQNLAELRDRISLPNNE